MAFRSPQASHTNTAPTGSRHGHGAGAGGPPSTGSNLPSWARQHSMQSMQHRAPTEENSDSDDDASEAGDNVRKNPFSPISRSLLASICIFGCDGNLAMKKIWPTLFQLWKRKLMPRDVLLFGYARADLTSDQFRKQVNRCIYDVRQPNEERKEFVKRVHYVKGEFDDHKSIAALHEKMEEFEEQRVKDRAKEAETRSFQRSPTLTGQRSPPMLAGHPGLPTAEGFSLGAPAGGPSSVGGETLSVPLSGVAGAGIAMGGIAMSKDRSFEKAAERAAKDQKDQVRMYYMAVPPFLYAAICGALRAVTAANPLGHRSGLRTVERFVLEKPFGRDTESCAQLVRELSMLREDEIYRIDHYLGKELVMNLLVLRFANVAFSSIWNRQTIKAVQVIFKEDFGTEGRGGYFDQYGIIRDVMQNHLLQVMALVAMEQPLSFTAEHIMQEKLKVLQACEPIQLDDLVIGQYTRSGKHPGYLEDPTITNKDSNTETFATAVLRVHTPRWDGVPFVLKAGKALTDRKAEVRIQFHTVPGAVSALKECAANELVVRLQPEQTIYWKVINKVPGLKFQVQQMRMDLLYANKFSSHSHEDHHMPEAYERLLLEVLAADHSHFVSAQELDASWRIFTPILNRLAADKIKPLPYPYGSRGPSAADDLAHKFGLSKFGGGITNYVQGQPPKKLTREDSVSTSVGASPTKAVLSAEGAAPLPAKPATSAAAASSSSAASSAATAAAAASSASSAPSSSAARMGEASSRRVLDQAATASLLAAAAPSTPSKERALGAKPAFATGGGGGSTNPPTTPDARGVTDVSDPKPPSPPAAAASPSSAAGGVPRQHTRSPTSSPEMSPEPGSNTQKMAKMALANAHIPQSKK